jgi:hypothetical protein
MFTPSGTIACVICFHYFPPEKLADAGDGKKWDICAECGELEAMGSLFIHMTLLRPPI